MVYIFISNTYIRSAADSHVVAHAEKGKAGKIEYVGAVMDHTVAKGAEDKIRQIIDTIPAYAWSAKPDGAVDFVNQRFVEFTGRSNEELLGWEWKCTVHPDDLPGFVGLWRAALAAGAPMESEVRLRRSDGHYHWLLNRNVPLLDEQGNIIKWYGTAIEIDDRKRAEAAARRNEEHLAEAQRLSKTGSWVWNAGTKENVFWSKELRRIYGFDPETSIVPYAAARERVHPEDGTAFDETFHRALREKRNFQIDHRIVLPGGEVKHIHVVGHPVLNDPGELVEYVGTVLDVTERKRAEMEAQAHLWFLESMDRINRAIQGANDLEEMMSEALKAVLAIFNCDRAWLVYPCDPEAPTWRAVMEHVRPEFPGAFALGVDLPLDPEVAAVFGRVRGSSGSVCFGPKSEDLVPSLLAERFSIRSMIGLALYPKLDKPYIFGLHQCTQLRVWTLPEQRLFQEIGRRMEDALSTLLIFRSLQNSELKLEEAQRIAHVGHWERDLDTDLIAWSRETYRIYGLPPQKHFPGLSQLAKLLHPEDRQAMIQAVADAVNGVRSYNVEYRIIRPDGEVRFVHSTGDVVKDESGRPRRMFGTVQDITERKLAEEALRRSETYLGEAQKLTHAGSWAYNVSTGELVHSSEEHRRLFGFDPEKGIPSFDELVLRIHPEDRGFALREFDTTTPSGNDFDAHFRIVLPDGAIRYVYGTGHPVFSPSGDVREFVGMVMDVTEHKRAEEALRRSEYYLAEAQKLSHTGSWARSLATDEISYWSEECCRVLGFDPRGGTPQFETFLRRVHPDDQDKVRKTAETARLEETEYEVDYRIVHPDGQIRDIHAVGRPAFSPSGELVEYVGTVIDVTERKQAEAGLIEQARLLNLTHDLIFVRDMNNVITYWNHGAEEFYGWTAAETVGKASSHQLLQTVFPAPLDEIDEELLRTGRWEGELKHTRADGIQVVVASRWSLQRDQQGRPVAVLQTNNDITERKRAEEAWRQAQAELAHITRITTMGELTASIAHEVNQPLAAVVTNANACLRWLAADTPNFDEARNAIHRIVRDATRASDVIARIRALVKKDKSVACRLDVNDFLREIVELTQSEVARRGASLQANLAANLPAVTGDRVQLQQVLLNLIINAVDAMSALTDRPRLVRIRTHEAEAKSILIAVEDSGIGLDPEQAARLFDAFYTTKAAGLGMGLSISRSIVEAHGGKLWATPNDGPGATFQFTLPIEEG
jgi:PAS domain S-box-containing protein